MKVVSDPSIVANKRMKKVLISHNQGQGKPEEFGERKQWGNSLSISNFPTSQTQWRVLTWSSSTYLRDVVSVLMTTSWGNNEGPRTMLKYNGKAVEGFDSAPQRPRSRTI